MEEPKPDGLTVVLGIIVVSLLIFWSCLLTYEITEYFKRQEERIQELEKKIEGK